MSKSKSQTKLIVAASEYDADMLYATRFFAPDPFIFLERNGKRTLVLSDLEIDRAKKTAHANEFLSYNKFEREIQGTSKKAPAYEKVLAYFLRKRGVRSAVVPANFPLGYARELAANKIRLQPTNGLFWPEREAKNRRGTSPDAARSRYYRKRNGACDGSSDARPSRKGKSCSGQANR